MRLPPLHRRWLCLLLAWTLVWAPLAVWAGWSHPHANGHASPAAAGGEHAHCGTADPVAPESPCPCPADTCDCLMALPSALPAIPLVPGRTRWAAQESPPPPLLRASRHLQPLLRPPAG